MKSGDFAQTCLKGSSHDSNLMTHTASDRRGIVLCLDIFKNMILPTYAPSLRLRKTFKCIKAKLHIILKTHIGVKMFAIKFSFNSARSHPPTQSPASAKLKKPKICLNIANISFIAFEPYGKQECNTESNNHLAYY